MNNPPVSLSLRVELEGDNLARFEAVKKRLGLKNNSEVIRAIIHEAYRSLSPSDSPEEKPVQELPV